MSTDTDGIVRVIADAYVALLRLPPRQRMFVNAELAHCRDAIADLSGLNPETVQVGHEALAALKGEL